jgi:hypothetical protein
MRRFNGTSSAALRSAISAPPASELGSVVLALLARARNTFSVPRTKRDDDVLFSTSSGAPVSRNTVMDRLGYRQITTAQQYLDSLPDAGDERPRLSRRSEAAAIR